MFWQIFLFEIKYRIKRPDTYLYFLAFFLFAFLAFSNGNVPASEKIYVNAPVVITKFFTIVSIFMMVVTAAVMGGPLYRDIEYNTHEYYLSYPITKNGYFWGRFLGSFLFVLIIASSLVWGSVAGSVAGPKLGWLAADRVGPFHAVHFTQPFFGFVVPNLLLTSSIFFGLVAYTRNIKVIYTGGVVLYITYVMSLFIMKNLTDRNIVFLLDAFGFNPIEMIDRFFSPEQQNNSLIPLESRMLMNRLIWSGVGLGILFITYFRFSFHRFFTGREHKKNLAGKITGARHFFKKIPAVITSFTGTYNRNVIYTLSKIELLSITRDSYFRLILGVGIFFLGFIFWLGFGNTYGVPDFPRTVMLMDIYNHNFLLFVFMILLFYTGETVHRERSTRFAIINDALPPADWVLYGSKLVALFCIAFILATVPLLVGVIIQIAKGYTHFNFPAYFAACYGISLPMFIEMIMFSFIVHVVINNKFAAHAVALMIWVLMLAVTSTGKFNYYLLLYSYTPEYIISEMDGVSPAVKPLFWFNVYWLFCGGLLLACSALFYYRGVIASFRERVRLAIHRFQGRLKIISTILLIGFLGTGAYNYYNVSYLNTWLTNSEKEEREVAFEKQLKKYEHLPLPGIVKLKLFEDIFPEERRVVVKAFVTIVNKTNKPIARILLDGDDLSEYSIKYNGEKIPYTNPLIYPAAKFSFFKPANDTSMYRVYQFPVPLKPGDSALVEINSVIENIGFANNMEGVGLLHNGTAFNGALPDIGYDEGEELSSSEKRKQYHLPPKIDELPAQDDPEAVRHLIFSDIADLVSYEATISTSSDQLVVAPGILKREWKRNGRNYFQYVLDNPKTYFPFPSFSGRYSVVRDSVELDNKQPIAIEIYYNPSHTANLGRFIAALKDGITYFSKAYGPYEFNQFRLIESSAFFNRASFSDAIVYGENFGWHANFTNPAQFDYCYFFTTYQLCRHWWMYQVAPNHTLGSNNIANGLAKYGALILAEKKYGKDNMKAILNNEMNEYLWRHNWGFKKENALINSNFGFISENKAAIILYGLKDLIGEDSLNSALREFRNDYAFRDKPPYAGSNDLYRAIQKHTPDSLQYYLTDSWERITFYENKLLEVSMTRVGKNETYKVHLKLSTRKIYLDGNRADKPGENMNDYIDIAVFAADSKNKEGRPQTNPLYIKKYHLTPGEHEFDIIVKGKPVSAGIDPFNKLMDLTPEDNLKSL